MAVMPWQPLHNQTSCIDGEVSIDPSAVVAPGVVLIANPQSQIVIGAGACIGMGVVLHADGGSLRVEEGAILGAGVLMVGSGTIGARACVGPVSTVFNCSVKSEEVVAPGSLLGDRGREATEAIETPAKRGTDTFIQEPIAPVDVPVDPPKPDSEVKPPSTQSNPSATQASIHSAIARNLIANPPSTHTRPHPELPNSEPTSVENSNHQNNHQNSEIGNSNSSVYGQQHLQRLMATLFPHRQQLNSGLQDSPVSEDQDQ